MLRQRGTGRSTLERAGGLAHLIAAGRVLGAGSKRKRAEAPPPDDEEMNMDEPDDEWAHRLHCRTTTALINDAQIPRLWYEDVLFGSEAPFLDVPTFLTVPPKLVEPLLRARATAADLLEGVTEMEVAVNTMIKAGESLADLHKGFECDLGFLEQRAMSLLIEKIHQSVLACMPTEDDHFDFAEAGDQVV